MSGELEGVQAVAKRLSGATTEVDASLKTIDKTLHHLREVLEATIRRSDKVQASIGELTGSL